MIFAYLDPGTGSFIIHIIVGGLVGVAYWARVSWRKISVIAIAVISKLRSFRDDTPPSQSQ